MEFQRFEIKSEADNDVCPYDVKLSTGMFAVSDDIFSALSRSRGSVVSCCGSVIVMDCQLGSFHCHPCKSSVICRRTSVVVL